MIKLFNVILACQRQDVTVSSNIEGGCEGLWASECGQTFRSSTAAADCTGKLWLYCLRCYTTAIEQRPLSSLLLFRQPGDTAPLVVRRRLEDGRSRDRSSLSPVEQRTFSVLNHTSDFNSGTYVTRLPRAWRFRDGARTGWPDVSTL